MAYNKQQLNTACKCGHARVSHYHCEGNCEVGAHSRFVSGLKNCNCKKFEEA